MPSNFHLSISKLISDHFEMATAQVCFQIKVIRVPKRYKTQLRNWLIRIGLLWSKGGDWWVNYARELRILNLFVTRLTLYFAFEQFFWFMATYLKTIKRLIMELITFMWWKQLDFWVPRNWHINHINGQFGTKLGLKFWLSVKESRHETRKE